MAKDNLFLGFARGKIGDVVFSRQGGQQVSRARNRAPRNPQTPLQLLQRVVLKTNSAAYSLMKEICDHSFQGFTLGTENQSEFVRENVRLMREKLADLINGGDGEAILMSDETNYSQRGQFSVPLNDYLVSDGSIPANKWKLVPSGTGSSTTFGFQCEGFVMLPDAPQAQTDVTWMQACEAFGCQPGDQLTFVWLTADDTEDAIEQSVANSFGYARLIMMPGDGDMSKPMFVAGEGGGTYALNDPNPRNEGDFLFTYVQYTMFVEFPYSYVGDNGKVNTLAAGAVITSRLSGETWQRSRARLSVRPSGTTTAGHFAFDAETLFLGDAVRSFMKDSSSLLYLNQAET